MLASDGTRLVEAEPFLNLTPFEVHEHDPYTCTTGWDGGHYCYGYDEDPVGRQAFVSTFE